MAMLAEASVLVTRLDSIVAEEIGSSDTPRVELVRAALVDHREALIHHVVPRRFDPPVS